jgi:hypothetical protein
MKAMLGVLKGPYRRASIGFNAWTWLAAERWVKCVMWLLVLAVTCWDLAATFGHHFTLN